MTAGSADTEDIVTDGAQLDEFVCSCEYLSVDSNVMFVVRRRSLST